MNSHPIDSIPAFVLGALEPGEAAQVAAHLAQCPACHAEAEAYRATLAALPTADFPPPRVKREVFTRIAFEQRMVTLERQTYWMRAALVTVVVLALAFGTLALYARAHTQVLAAELAQTQKEAVALRDKIAQQQAVAVFIAAPQTLLRRLDSPDRQARAVMYMQPGSAHAVLVVQGLPPLPAGTTYQFWFARPGAQVPSATFAVGQDGSASLAVEAPTPVGEYEQVMVTLEANGGSRQPSAQIMLSGSLASALRPAPLARAAPPAGMPPPPAIWPARAARR